MQKTWVRILSTALTLGVMVMIFCFSMEPAERSDASSGKISEWVADRVQPEWRTYPHTRRVSFFNTVQYIVRKCAHYSEFAMLGLCLRWCLESWAGQKKKLWAIAWLGGTLYAGFDELHQLWVDGRSGQWTDVCIDSAGVICGALIMTWILFLIRKRQRDRSANGTISS